jgi:hypothetical protein
MKKIIITESQLNLLFEQGHDPSTTINSGDKISDADAVRQLSDNNGTKYSISLKTDADEKSRDCKEKGKLKLLQDRDVESLLTSHNVYYNTSGRMCFMNVQSSCKRGWMSSNEHYKTVASNNCWFLTFWDFGKTVITIEPASLVEVTIDGNVQYIYQFEYEGTFKDNGTEIEIENLKLTYCTTTAGKRLSPNDKVESGEYLKDIEYYINGTTTHKAESMLPNSGKLSDYITMLEGYMP